MLQCLPWKDFEWHASCGMWDLHHNMRDLSLWRSGSVVATHRFSCPAARGILLRRPGIKPVPLHLKFLTSGPLGKSPHSSFFFFQPEAGLLSLFYRRDPKAPSCDTRVGLLAKRFKSSCWILASQMAQ